MSNIKDVVVAEGWELNNLGIAGECIRGVSYKPTNITQIPNKNNICILRSNNIKNNKVNFKEVVYLKDINIRQNQILEEGDITICMSNGSKALVGKNATFKGNNHITSIGAFCGLFRVNSMYSTQYIKSLFESTYYKNQIDVMLAGSAINNLKNSDITDLILPFPNSLQEQQKIAEILSTVDEAIEKTDALIEKYKKIKTGLMEDLFTKGIDVTTGKPHTKFKESELGRIPEIWDVSILGEYIDIYSGFPPSLIHFSSNGINYYKVEQIRSEQKYLDKSKYNISNKKDKIFPKGVILFPKRGAAIFLNKINISRCICLCDTNVMGIHSNILDNEYLYYYLKYLNLSNIADTSSIPQINNKHIEPLLIKIPYIQEQEKIAEILSEADKKIEKEEVYKKKLEKIKKGLMNDLLTGAVRVKY